MGFRYRKSINIGGGFRINISKSGIGYSWGTKGYRVTKMANGATRKTISIPGTGISFVDQESAGKPKNSLSLSNYGTSETIEIKNNIDSKAASPGLEDVLSAAEATLLADRITRIFLVVFGALFLFNALFAIPLLCSIAMKIYVRRAGVIDLSYSIDDLQKKFLYARLKHVLKAAKSEKTWRIVESSKSNNIKYSSGASTLLKRSICKTTTVAPFPFSSNMLTISFKSKKETLVFFPDKLFLIQGVKVCAFSYNDISLSSGTTKFIEEERVPSDSKIVGRTWKYVNISGGPDKRFKGNRELPICLYGQIRLTSPVGLNTLIMFSNSTG